MAVNPELSDDPQSLTRKAVRVAWARDTMAALHAAQRQADQAWERMLRSPSPLEGEGWGEGDEDEDLPPPAEQAQVDAIHAAIRAVIDHDRWPRQLYWSL